MYFNIPGKPIPKARHRSFIRGNHIASYDSQDKIKNEIKHQLLEQMNKYKNHDDEKTAQEANSLAAGECFVVHMIFDMPIPSSWSEKKKRQYWLKPHNVKPDIDNLVKFIFDCGNDILFSDDSKIYRLTTEKKYSFIPSTTIFIEKICQLEKEIDCDNIHFEINKKV